jgi:predicted methyltransferase
MRTQNKNLTLLLDVILRNGDIRKLINDGLDYQSIADLTKLALKDGYLQVDEGKIKVSKSGLSFIEKNKDLTIKSKEDWIRPLDKSKIRRLEKNEIFLPKQDELTF